MARWCTRVETTLDQLYLFLAAGGGLALFAGGAAARSTSDVVDLHISRFTGVVDQVVLERIQHDGSSGRYTDLVVGVLNMMSHGTIRDREQTRGLAVGQTACDEPQYLDLTTAKPIRPQTAATSAMAATGQHGFDCRPFLTAVPHVVAKVCRGSSRRQSRTVWTWLRHRLIGVGRTEQTHGGTQIASAHATVIPAPIHAFVVRSGDLCQGRKCWAAGQQTPSQIRVEPHALPLRIG